MLINREEVLREIGNRLLNQGYVKKSFVDAIIKEKKNSQQEYKQKA